ncbi:MAG: CHAT domain-containing protein [Clostridiales bacterium]|nr:CHAT domain-containing protein [Clostridiales bacterium]
MIHSRSKSHFLVILGIGVLFFISGISVCYAEDNVMVSNRDHATIGLVVENVLKEGTAAKAGILDGDNLQSWSFKNHDEIKFSKQLSGKFSNPFDYLFFLKEYSPRGIVLVTIVRDASKKIIELPLGEWDFDVRPVLSAEMTKQYDTLNEFDTKEHVENRVSILEQMARTALEKNINILACWIYYKIGHLFTNAKKTVETQQKIQLAIDLAEKAQDIKAQIILNDFLAFHYFENQEYEKAIEYYTAAMKLKERLLGKDSIGYANSLSYFGGVSWKKEKVSEAEKYYREEHEILLKSAPHSSNMAKNYLSLGRNAWKQSNYYEGEKFLDKSIEIQSKIESKSMITVMAIGNKAIIARHAGNLDKAEILNKQALEILNEISPDHPSIMIFYNNLGILAYYKGDFASADKYYQKTYDLCIKNQPGSMLHAKLLNNLAQVAKYRGNLIQAEEYYNESLKIKMKINKTSAGVAMAYNNLGLLNKERGNTRAAKEYYAKALDLQKQISPTSPDVAMTLLNMATDAMDMKDFELAEKYLKESLDIRRAIAPDSMDEAYCINSLGDLASEQNKLNDAMTYYSKSLNMMLNKQPNNQQVAECYVDIATVEFKRQDYKKAESNVGKALDIMKRQVSGTEREAQVFHFMGRIKREQKDMEGALRYFQAAVNALERQKETWGNEENLHYFLTQNAIMYKDLIDVQVLLNKQSEAFHTLEKYRSSILLKMLAEKDLDFSLDAPEELLTELSHLDSKYDKTFFNASRMNRIDNKVELEALEKELRQIYDDRHAIKAKLKNMSPRLVSLQYPEPLNMEDVIDIFDNDTLFLSYSVGDDTIQLFSVFQGSLTVDTLSISRKKLAKLVEEYRNVLISPHINPSEIGIRLFKRLLGTKKNDIKKAKRVIICPDKELHFLPFSALCSKKNRYLIDDVPVSTVISATVYSELTKDPASTGKKLSLVAFGDPLYPREEAMAVSDATVRSMNEQFEYKPIPASEREVENICNLYGSTSRSYLRETALEENVKKLDEDVRMIHIACHGILDEQFPMNSGLVLTIPQEFASGQDNGIFQVWEIFESLRIDADLVTLSACHTGLGKEISGEGLIGLNRAFLYAGAKSVVSTLWQVEDQSTAEFMLYFYSYLHSGYDTSEALRKAQLDFIHRLITIEKVIQGEKRKIEINVSHPFFWAGFVLNGDWN